MRIKQRPEDFSVKESYRFEEDPDGKFRVYLMDKQKLSTFDAIARIRERFGLKPGAISYCGLKDKQGRTEQLIAVESADVDIQDPDLRLKYLGRAKAPLTAANTTSNRFSVTVRSVTEDDVGKLTVSSAEVGRLGVVNYFDSQRFGSLKHGQGFIAKDLLRGDFEAALRNYMAKPSPLDQSEDAKVKQFWKENWGKWEKKVPYAGTKKYFRILQSLRDYPGDFLRAFLQIDSDYRALLIFTYQSYLWNEGVRKLLADVLPRESLFPAPYQAGTLLFHRDAPPDVLSFLRSASFPLVAANTSYKDERVRKACEWALGKEKLKLSDLRVPGAERILYFKHEERPVIVYPEKLVLGQRSRDELNPGKTKLNVAFTLPPGSYATLVVKRLFHFSYSEEEHAHVPGPPKREEREERPGFRERAQIEKDARSQRRETAQSERPTANRKDQRPGGQKTHEGRGSWGTKAKGQKPFAGTPRTESRPSGPPRDGARKAKSSGAFGERASTRGAGRNPRKPRDK